MQNRLLASILAGVFGFGAPFALQAQDGPGGFTTRATSAYVLDLGTGTVLLEKNADEPLPPASMSKLMTLGNAVRGDQGRAFGA